MQFQWNFNGTKLSRFDKVTPYTSFWYILAMGTTQLWVRGIVRVMHSTGPGKKENKKPYVKTNYIALELWFQGTMIKIQGDIYWFTLGAKGDWTLDTATTDCCSISILPHCSVTMPQGNKSVSDHAKSAAKAIWKKIKPYSSSHLPCQQPQSWLRLISSLPQQRRTILQPSLQLATGWRQGLMNTVVMQIHAPRKQPPMPKMTLQYSFITNMPKSPLKNQLKSQQIFFQHILPSVWLKTMSLCLLWIPYELLSSATSKICKHLYYP